VAKPIRRGVLLKTKKEGNPEWFDIQYEKHPFFCKACGIMGHSELECNKKVARYPLGKLPYDIKLRAPDGRRKKIQSFTEAVAESMGVVPLLAQSSHMGLHQDRRSSVLHLRKAARRLMMMRKLPPI
jgi:hypothetical protein